MNKKVIYWLVGSVAIIAIAIAFTLNVQPASDELKPIVDEQASSDDIDGLPANEISDAPNEDEGMESEDYDDSLPQEQFLVEVEIELAELKAAMEEYRLQAAPEIAQGLAQLDAKIAQIEKTLETAKVTSDENWPGLRKQIQQQYQEIVEALSASISSAQPSSADEP